MNDQKLTDALKNHIRDLSRQAALVGVASADRFEDAPPGHQPKDFVPEARSVVVVALPIVSGMMRWNNFMAESQIIKEEDVYTDESGQQQTWRPRTVIRKHVERRCSYEVINNELQALSMHAAIFLERAGHVSAYLPTTYGQTLSWPGNVQWDFPYPPKAFAPFSHRHAAVAAGLGTFGLNNLFLTPQYGPRQRLVSVITAAPLVVDAMLTKSVCLGEKCSLCLRSCPAHAFGESHELRVGATDHKLAAFNKDACRNYYKASAWGEQCGRECMTSCPLGRLRKPSGNFPEGAKQ